MVLFAALFLTTATTQPAAPPVQRVAAERQAVAMVRIVRGAPVKFSELEKIAPGRFTFALVRNADGAPQPARLVEFQ
jgi:hypothetical protein